MTATQAYAPGECAGGTGGAVDPAKDKLYVPDGPDGKGYYARSEKEAEEGRGLASADEAIKPVLSRLKEVRADSFSTTEGYIREAENLRTGFGEPFPPLPASLLQFQRAVQRTPEDSENQLRFRLVTLWSKGGSNP